MLSNRFLVIFGTIFCFGLLVIAVILQRVFNMEPCTLCMAQRYILLALGIVFLCAIFLIRFSFFRFIFAILIAIGSVLGIVTAIRHIWIQNLPADEVPTCGPGFDYLVNNFPMMDAINAIWTGSGDCTTVDKVLGLPISVWTLMAFCVIFLITLRLFFHRDAQQADSSYY